MRKPSMRRIVALSTLAVAATLLLSACGKTEQVCQGRPQRVLVIPLTSTSDIAIAKAFAKAVAEQAAERAVQSCGMIGAGIAGARVESDLVVHFHALRPKRRMAPNRNPELRGLRRDAMRWYADYLERPLAATQATHGSPFLGTLAKIAAEPTALDNAPLTIALVGDGIDVEPAPSGRMVNLYRRTVDMRAMREFVPLLKPLRYSCVLLLGSGARSKLAPQLLRRNRALLKAILREAGIGFAATRSSQLPRTCEASS